MSVKIRMSRHGRRHRPFFRINVIDTRTPRDGRIIEKLGYYDPLEKNAEKELVLDIERAKYWLDKGAIPSDSVSEILLRKGIKHKYAAEKKTRRALARKRARAAGLPFLKSERKTEEKPAAGASSTPSTSSGQASSPQAAPAAEKPKTENK
ncbi:MAG: 30S ribosomal protein S16 [Sedimentisphaerales bacterium]|jgi:small subunit ribosomal protein S16